MKPASDKSEIVAAIPVACSHEPAAAEFLERMRWGDEPKCPECQSTNVYKMASRTGERHKRYLWRCRGCNKQYTVRVGTVMEDSQIPMRHWCYAFWAACASKKGVSALQIKRQTGLTYKSALFLMHRIRHAMSDVGEPQPRLSGVIEADETYVGGKPRVRGTRKRGRGTTKAPVFALVERGGRVRAWTVTKVTAKNLRNMIVETTDPSSRFMTDESNLYFGVGKEFEGGHESVKHSIGEYVRGDAHTNTVEGFFSLVKRGMYGTFHAVSKKHLHRYLDEFAFRYNQRHVEDGARVHAAITGAEGKRLLYRQPVAGEKA